jgi:hypothetical protein
MWGFAEAAGVVCVHVVAMGPTKVCNVEPLWPCVLRSWVVEWVSTLVACESGKEASNFCILHSELGCESCVGCSQVGY